MIFINLKTYQQGTASKALSLIKAFEEAAHATGIKVAVAVQAADIYEAVRITRLEIWSQAIDPYSFGAHTGGILAEAVVEDGAVGTFLNHSEHKLASYSDLTTASKHAHDVGLKTMIFAPTLVEVQKILALNPTYLAYEPPELIGNPHTSVANAQPELIKKAALFTKEKGIPLIVGAGIKSCQDVAVSLDLGALGVAVASDVVTATHPKKELLNLMEGFSQ